MAKCLNCQGDGLAGQGDRPWTKEGNVFVCPPCKGTGKIDEGNSIPIEVINEPVLDDGDTPTHEEVE